MILVWFLLVFGDSFFDLLGCLERLVGTFCSLWIVRGLLVVLLTSLGPSGGHFGGHFGTLGDIFGLLGASLVVFLGLLGSSWGHFWRHRGHLGRHGRPKSKNRPGDPKFRPHFGMILGVKTTPQNDQTNCVQKVVKNGRVATRFGRTHFERISRRAAPRDQFEARNCNT